MRNFKCTVFVLALLMVCSLFIGCQQDVSDNGSSLSEQGAPVENNADDKKDMPRVAFVLKTLANEYWAGVNDGILKRAEEIGMEVTVFAGENESDAQGQLKKFEDALLQDFDVIAFSPISPANLNTAIVKANEAGIPVLNIDDLADIEDLEKIGGYLDAFVSADNVLMGKMGAEEIVKQLGDEGGEVAIIEGISGVMGSEHRKQGAREVFDACENIKVVTEQPAEWDRVKALDVATNILQSNPNLKAFHCANDTMALGVIEAVNNAGKAGEILVTGCDGSPEAIQSIASGGMTATVLQDTYVTGATSVDAAFALYKDGGAKSGKMETIYVELQLITKDNADEF